MTSFHQAQDWTTGINQGVMRGRSVIAERRTKLRAVSSEGIREDVAYIVFSLIVIFAVSLLLLDLSALQSSSSAAGRLSSEITMLEDTNSILSERLAINADRARYRVTPVSENMIQVDEIPTVTISIPDSSLTFMSVTLGAGQ